MQQHRANAERCIASCGPSSADGLAGVQHHLHHTCILTPLNTLPLRSRLL
jgi:uncharacterized membrane protein YhdT